MGFTLPFVVLLLPYVVWQVLSARRMPGAGSARWYADRLGRAAQWALLIVLGIVLPLATMGILASGDGLAVMGVALLAAYAIYGMGWAFGLVVSYLSERRLRDAGRSGAWVAVYLAVLLILAVLPMLLSVPASALWTGMWILTLRGLRRRGQAAA